MTSNIIEKITSHNIHCYGSEELLNFEKQMTRYFEREYERWRGNNNTPESYNTSSFKGDIVPKEENTRSIDHYNKDLKIYQAFLDKKYMAYSMAYYGISENPETINQSISLEQAQKEKYKLIVQRADIQDGQNILDIGCGFGGFIKYLFEEFPNITVTGLNPSATQTEYIRNALTFDSSRFNLLQQRFDENSQNSIPHNTYDRIISIGAFEHFSNFDFLFKYQNNILKQGGKCLHHLIVSVDTIPHFLNAENILMADYFPGGHIWPYSELKRHNTHLQLKDCWFVNGMNYWKTLDEWHKRFWQAIDQLFPDYLSIEDVESWNRYFVLCKAMFRPDQGRSYGVGHYLYEKT
jgi:cyclopropane-fatty-acyl-phospholipid synthase